MAVFNSSHNKREKNQSENLIFSNESYITYLKITASSGVIRMANIKTQSGEASSLVGMLNNDFRFDFF